MWESEFDIIISRKDKVQDLSNNQIKFQLYENYKKDEKIKTNFELVNKDDGINKTYLDGVFFEKRWSPIIIKERLQLI